jgi:hypothetical protein
MPPHYEVRIEIAINNEVFFEPPAKVRTQNGERPCIVIESHIDLKTTVTFESMP